MPWLSCDDHLARNPLSSVIHAVIIEAVGPADGVQFHPVAAGITLEIFLVNHLSVSAHHTEAYHALLRQGEGDCGDFCGRVRDVLSQAPIQSGHFADAHTVAVAAELPGEGVVAVDAVAVEGLHIGSQGVFASVVGNLVGHGKCMVLGFVDGQVVDHFADVFHHPVAVVDHIHMHHDVVGIQVADVGDPHGGRELGLAQGLVGGGDFQYLYVNRIRNLHIADNLYCIVAVIGVAGEFGLQFEEVVGLVFADIRHGEGPAHRVDEGVSGTEMLTDCIHYHLVAVDAHAQQHLVHGDVAVIGDNRGDCHLLPAQFVQLVVQAKQGVNGNVLQDEQAGVADGVVEGIVVVGLHAGLKIIGTVGIQSDLSEDDGVRLETAEAVVVAHLVAVADRAGYI